MTSLAPSNSALNLNVIILAGGLSTRFLSSLPKVYHTLAGKPLLQYSIETAQKLNPRAIYVVYHPNVSGEFSRQTLSKNFPNVYWVEQLQPLGTGYATLQALAHIDSSPSRTLILLADTPLLQYDTLERLLDQTRDNWVGLITTNLSNPNGYGRIVRNGQGEVVEIVEDKDACAAHKALNEINSGVLLVQTQCLKECLTQITHHNIQTEFYLTSVVALALQKNIEIVTITPHSELEIFGVNDRWQLVSLERTYQKQQARAFMLAGVQITDPDCFYLRGELIAEQDSVIDTNVVLNGTVKLGAGSIIGPGTWLKNVVIGTNVIIKGYCFIEDTVIGDDCIVGPYARLRPDTKLASGVHIGHFVEIKNAQIGIQSRVNHLAYIGDAEVGAHVNVGAGAITCNYDGVDKHRTLIEDDAFIGSNSALIAPIKIGKGATIGAGSTITKDVPEFSLALNRASRKTIVGWKKDKKREKY